MRCMRISSALQVVDDVGRSSEDGRQTKVNKMMRGCARFSVRASAPLAVLPRWMWAAVCATCDTAALHALATIAITATSLYATRRMARWHGALPRGHVPPRRHHVTMLRRVNDSN